MHTQPEFQAPSQYFQTIPTFTSPVIKGGKGNKSGFHEEFSHF